MEDTRFSVSIQILMTLAHDCHDLVTSEKLADILKTNPTFIRKLVASLVNFGLVESIRGQSGGFRLNRSPKEISLKDVYLASTHEKKIITVHKKPTTKSCPVSCCIEKVVSRVSDDVEKLTQDYLSRKKLSDLMKEV